MLNWQLCKYDPRSFNVKGTVLNVAFAGENKRFAIYEIRTRVRSNDVDQQLYPGVTYIVRDASTVSDDDVRAGKQPGIVFRSDDCDECERFTKM